MIVADYEVTTSNDPRTGLVDLRIDTQVPRETLMLLQGAADLCGLSVGEVVSFWLWEIAKQKSELVTRDVDGRFTRRTDTKSQTQW